MSTKESPQARVDYYVDRQLQQNRENGVSVSAEQVRKETVALLQFADVSARDVPVRSRRPEKDPRDVVEAKRKLGPQAQAEASGTEFFYRDEAVEPLITKPKRTPLPPNGVEGEKHFALLKRIRLLMKRIPNYRLKPGESLYAGHVYPRFAQLLDMHTRYASLDDPQSHGLGGYSEMPIGDRQRRYYRELERICDLSNTVVGYGWWIKY